MSELAHTFDPENVELSLIETCEEIDTKIEKMCPRESGSCMAGIIYDQTAEEKLAHCFWVGDCRISTYDFKESKINHISTDHDLKNNRELQRLVYSYSLLGERII